MTLEAIRLNRTIIQIRDLLASGSDGGLTQNSGEKLADDLMNKIIDLSDSVSIATVIDSYNGLILNLKSAKLIGLPKYFQCLSDISMVRQELNPVEGNNYYFKVLNAWLASSTTTDITNSPLLRYSARKLSATVKFCQGFMEYLNSTAVKGYFLGRIGTMYLNEELLADPSVRNTMEDTIDLAISLGWTTPADVGEFLKQCAQYPVMDSHYRLDGTFKSIDDYVNRMTESFTHKDQ